MIMVGSGFKDHFNVVTYCYYGTINLFLHLHSFEKDHQPYYNLYFMQGYYASYPLYSLPLYHY